MEKLQLPINFMNTLLSNVEEVIDFCAENNLTNEQEFINFLDKLNTLSVKY